MSACIAELRRAIAERIEADIALLNRLDGSAAAMPAVLSGKASTVRQGGPAA